MTDTCFRYRKSFARQKRKHTKWTSYTLSCTCSKKTKHFRSNQTKIHPQRVAGINIRNSVPSATIAKFEQKHTISLASYLALAKALGYTNEIKKLLSQPLYHTMEELDMINKNKKRKRGRSHEASK